MSKKATNCPNCGAPIKGARCEYCGTEYTEEESLSIDHVEIEGDGLNVKIEGLKKTSSFLNGDFKKKRKNLNFFVYNTKFLPIFAAKNKT